MQDRKFEEIIKYILYKKLKQEKGKKKINIEEIANEIKKLKIWQNITTHHYFIVLENLVDKLNIPVSTTREAKADNVKYWYVNKKDTQHLKKVENINSIINYYLSFSTFNEGWFERFSSIDKKIEKQINELKKINENK